MTYLVLIGLVVAVALLWNEQKSLRCRLEMLEQAGWRTPEPEPAQIPEPVEAPLPEPVRPAVARVVRRAPLAVPPPPERVIEAPVYEEPTPEPQPERGGGFEEMFGRKLPIWAGGATLAVAGFFIVKYSIDAGLLSPVFRVFFGLIFGLGLIGGAEAAHRLAGRIRDPRVPQALAGAGVATLYGAILVAANLYGLIGGGLAFAGLALVTLAAGFLSLRFGPASAILGLVGGLAAPALVGAGPPNMPLLATYLALAVGGLCALGRSQRWWWLGALALAGGFGWGLTLILAGVLDATAALSLGAYTLLIGIVFPLFLTGGPDRAVRWGGALAGCAQMAAIVATGGFSPLNWALYALISAGAVWLSRRDERLGDLPLPALAIALMLAAAWPSPSNAMLAAVIAGLALNFGGPALLRLWREDGRLTDAVQLAAIAFAIGVLPLMHLIGVPDLTLAAFALLGALVTGGAAALGWRKPRDDARFVLLIATSAALLALAAGLTLPAWMLAPAIAMIAGGLLLLALKAEDRRVERAAWGFAAAAIAFLVLSGPGWEDAARMADLASGQPLWPSLARWTIAALVALLFALRTRPVARPVAQALAVLLGYGAAAQIVPGAWLSLVPAVMVAAIAWTRRGRPIEAALATAAALALAWAALPLAQWAAIGAGALAGYPAYVGNLPHWTEALIRIAAPALAFGLALRFYSPFIPSEVEGRTQRIATLITGALALIATHILYKQLFALADHTDFVARAFAERTVWEALLAALATAAWRFGQRTIAIGAGALSLAHFTWFSVLVHNPLWADQAVGPWLIPAYAIAAALLWASARLDIAPNLARLRDGAAMALILVFGLTALRQIFHGPLLGTGAVGPAEDIARSAFAILAAVGFLAWGIRRAARDWRIASLVLMLAAVAKVFLLDAAGLDGLLRIASFAALGFSLIGVGWLYSRYLPEGRTS